MNKEDIEPLLKDYYDGNAYVKVTTRSQDPSRHLFKAMIEHYSDGWVKFKPCTQTEQGKFMKNLQYKDIVKIEILEPEEWNTHY